MPAGAEQCPCQTPHGRHVQMSLIHHCSQGDRYSHLLMRFSKLKDHTIRIICSSPPMGINHQKEKKNPWKTNFKFSQDPQVWNTFLKGRKALFLVSIPPTHKAEKTQESARPFAKSYLLWQSQLSLSTWSHLGLSKLGAWLRRPCHSLSCGILFWQKATDCMLSPVGNHPMLPLIQFIISTPSP